MARFFVFVVVVGGTALAAYLTRPTLADYQADIEKRQVVMQSDRGQTMAEMQLGGVLDRMAAAEEIWKLMQETTSRDFYVATIFWTNYGDEMGSHRVRTIGLFDTLIAREVYD